MLDPDAPLPMPELPASAVQEQGRLEPDAPLPAPWHIRIGGTAVTVDGTGELNLVIPDFADVDAARSR